MSEVIQLANPAYYGSSYVVELYYSNRDGVSMFMRATVSSTGVEFPHIDETDPIESYTLKDLKSMCSLIQRQTFKIEKHSD